MREARASRRRSDSLLACEKRISFGLSGTAQAKPVHFPPVIRQLMRYSLRPCARALPCHSILSKPIPFRQQRPDRSPHLESNLRPCIKIHSNPSTWLLSRPFRVPIANRCPIPQMTYIVLENQLPNLYSLLGLPSYAIYFCFSNHSPWNECSLTPA